MSKAEKEAEQIQQMYNVDEEHTALKTFVTGTYDSLTRLNSVDETVRPFKLIKGKNGPTTFCL